MQKILKEVINRELKHVSNWLIAYKLTLHVDKSSFLHFAVGRKKESMSVNGQCSSKWKNLFKVPRCTN